MKNTAMAVIFGALFGMMDSVSTTPSLMMAHLYGRAALGTLNSILSGLAIGFIGLGAVVFGLVKDYLGSYTGLLVVLLALAILEVLILLFLKEPKHPEKSEELDIIEKEQLRSENHNITS